MQNLLQKFKNIIHKGQAIWARNRFRYPDKKLTLIGVTGTDGKTTVTTMIYHILHESGLPTGYISTIKAKIEEKEFDTGLHVTTPNPWVIPKYLKMMVDSGIKYVVIEATSQGLEQNRLYGLTFDSVVITNIRYDHLDYHISWENYAEAKFKLLEMVTDKGLAVLNQDDEKSFKWLLLQSDRLKKYVYISIASEKMLFNRRQNINGIFFDYDNFPFNVPIIGEYNFINSLQAIKLCQRYVDFQKIRKALSTFGELEGRMQIMKKNPFVIIIDFAHTPRALESALRSMINLKQNGGRVITVFGCAGKRDKGRRNMGRIAASFGDIIILTAEDPRDEKLYDINNEIIKKAEEARGKLLFRLSDHEDYLEINFQMLINSINQSVNADEKPIIAFDEDSPNSRKDAINLAIKIARKNDIVFITGKGHEKSLAFGKKEYDWSDQEVVKELINR